MLALKSSSVIWIALFSLVCAKSATFVNRIINQESAEDSDGHGSGEVGNNGKISNVRENSLNGMANGNGNYVGHNGNIFLNIFTGMFGWNEEGKTSTNDPTQETDGPTEGATTVDYTTTDGTTAEPTTPEPTTRHETTTNDPTPETDGPTTTYPTITTDGGTTPDTTPIPTTEDYDWPTTGPYWP